MGEQFRIIQREMQPRLSLRIIAQRTINSATCTSYAAPANYLRRGNGRNIRLFLLEHGYPPQGAFQALRCAHNPT